MAFNPRQKNASFDQEIYSDSKDGLTYLDETQQHMRGLSPRQRNQNEFKKLKIRIDNKVKIADINGNQSNSVENKQNSQEIQKLQSKVAVQDSKLEGHIVPKQHLQDKMCDIKLPQIKGAIPLQQPHTPMMSPIQRNSIQDTQRSSADQLQKKFLKDVQLLNKQMNKVVTQGKRENAHVYKNPLEFLDKQLNSSQRGTDKQTPPLKTGNASQLRDKFGSKKVSKTQEFEIKNQNSIHSSISSIKDDANKQTINLKLTPEPEEKKALMKNRRKSIIPLSPEDLQQKFENETRMKFRKYKKAFMIYPENSYIDNWNIYVSIILLFTAIVTPMRIAFVEKDDKVWRFINGFVDLMFLFDIIVIFNTAYYDEEFRTIDDRKIIANEYVRSWFIIDVLSIIPFELIYGQNKGGFNSMAKILRIGRLYKLLKLTRLLKILKVLKGRGKFMKLVKDVIKIGHGFERLFFFIMMFLMVAHIVSCLWVLTATMSETEDSQSWLQDVPVITDIQFERHHWATTVSGRQYDPYNLYLISFYFTIETITTVGYGDYGPKTSAEKIFCIITMLIGVFAFSFMSGALSSILQTSDQSTAALNSKMALLNKIYSDYYLPLELYTNLKQTLKFNAKQDMEELNDFVEGLPHNLKIQVSLFLHEQTYKKIPFLKSRSDSFKAWVCPLLKPFLASPGQNIYHEDDDVHNIFFVKKGSCGFILPKHDNQVYINIQDGCYFGVIDVIGSMLQNQSGFDMLNDWNKHKLIIKRQYTIMAINECELLSFSLIDLNRMKTEFIECYEDLFSNGYQRLYRTLQVKLRAMKYCEKILVESVQNKLQTRISKMMRKNTNQKVEYTVKYDLKVLELEDIDDDEFFKAEFQEVEHHSGCSSDDSYDNSCISHDESSKSQCDNAHNNHEGQQAQFLQQASFLTKNTIPKKASKVVTESEEDSHSSCDSHNYALKQFEKKAKKQTGMNLQQQARNNRVMIKNAKKGAKKIVKENTIANDSIKGNVNGYNKQLTDFLGPLKPVDSQVDKKAQQAISEFESPQKDPQNDQVNIERLLVNLTSEILEIKNNQVQYQIQQDNKMDTIHEEIQQMRDSMRLMQQTD